LRVGNVTIDGHREDSQDDKDAIILIVEALEKMF